LALNNQTWMGDKSKIGTDEVSVFFPEATPIHFKIKIKNEYKSKKIFVTGF
tara:strand:- start:175 stop:327 length:153 start_codon:yes stop_codon:yes gene_type:complete